MIYQRTGMARVMAAIGLVTLLGQPVMAIESSVTDAQWQFKIDPKDAGVDEQWFDPKLDDHEWSSVSTHRWKGWVDQGLPDHEGFAWYRVAHEVPEELAKKHIYLHFAGVGDAAWVWVNGQNVGHHELVLGDDNPSWVRRFSFDVTELIRTGEMNQITVRVQNVKGSVAGIWQPVIFMASDWPKTTSDMWDPYAKLSKQILLGMDPVVRFDVWTTYAYQPVTLDDPPPSTEPAIVKQQINGSRARSFEEAIHLRGASGEWVPMAVRVHNPGEQPITVRCDFLPVRHAELGLQMAMDRVEVRSVDYILTKRKDLVPDPLPRLGDANSLRIEPTQTETFFVLIDTRGMPAGAWKGQLHLTPLRAGPFLDVPFQLDVAPVVLPERVPIWASMWSHPPNSLWMRDRRGSNEAYLSLMRRTGVTVVQSGQFPTPVLDDEEQIIGIDTVEFDRMLVRRGFSDQDFLVIGHFPHLRPGDNSVSYKSMFGNPGDPETSEQWEQNFHKYVAMVSQHIFENQGIPYERWGLYVLDENAGPFHVKLGKIVRAADPKIQLWVNRLEDLETMKKAEPYIDILVPYSPWLSRKGRGHGKHPQGERLMDEKGVPWWAYLHAWWQGAEKTAFPRATPMAAHNLLRMEPWLAWEQDFDGYVYWIYGMESYLGRYSGYPAVGLNAVQLDYPHTNCGLIYLGHDGPITSRQLEAHREGWEDYKLLWTIEQAVGLDGQDPAVVEQVQANMSVAATQILDDKDDIELFLTWRDKLLDDATKLCTSAPLDVAIADVKVTRNSVEVTCSASQPVRVWTWVDRGPNEYGFIEPTDASDAPVVVINKLVPGETCRLTLVFAGPAGQQKVITREVTTRGWN